jgi:hypothetical protein
MHEFVGAQDLMNAKVSDSTSSNGEDQPNSFLWILADCMPHGKGGDPGAESYHWK